MRNPEGDFNKVQMSSGGQGLNEGVLNSKEQDKSALKSPKKYNQKRAKVLQECCGVRERTRKTSFWRAEEFGGTRVKKEGLETERGPWSLRRASRQTRDD